ncbi:DUF4003 family protein [Vagococcus sp. BWB3-3]|uniref:DUF4003 family protein n=1 Tax=Vagococcus allomyrinae TaxID=2794353 RepID=A0A940PBL9_9ENTE|nr:DUF4003 family protein [Vagococcus allomyrinae]MBP1041770.1 DUF4003 family protein [Vagococcus allomyrinae]
MMRSLTLNYHTLKSTMKWTDKRILYLMAKAFIGREELLDTVEIERVRKRLKSETGFFTNLNATVRDIIIALMVANEKSSDKDVLLLLDSYNEMKEVGFKGSSYTYFGAYLLQFSKQSNKFETMKRGAEIYDAMKSSHPFITGKEDYSIAISLAQNEGLALFRPQEITDMVDFYYDGLRQAGLKSRDNAQAAAATCVLLLGEQSSRFVLEMENTVSELAKFDIKPKPLLYTSIVILTFLRQEVSDLTLDDLSEFLQEAEEHVKVFLDKNYQRTMALNLFIENQSKELGDEVTNTVAITLNQLIIQEQVMAAAAASSAAAAAASSSSAS